MAGVFQSFDLTSQGDDDADFAEFFQAYKAWKASGKGAPKSHTAEQTVAELWDAWFPTVEHTGRASNIRLHKKHALAHVFTFQGAQMKMGDLTPSACTPVLLEAWKAGLRAVIGHRKRPLAPDYRDQIRISLQSCFSYHVGIGTLSKNPLKGIPREDGWEGRRREGYLTQAELDRFIPHCRPILAAFLTLSFRSGGLRRDDMRLLKKHQVDWENLELVLPAKKGGEPRRVLLTEDSVELIRSFASMSPSEYVFASPSDPWGRPVPTSTLWRWLDNARNAAKMTLAGEPVVIHSARHGFTMRMADKAPDAWIADQLGHTDTTMIAKRYGRLRGRAARERMREMMEAKPAPDPKRRPPMQAPAQVIPMRKKDSGP